MPNGIELTFEELLQVPPLTQLLPNTMVASQRYGLLRSISRGRGMEFSEVRAYLPGDDIRNIDWRITARTGRPYTKLFREERDRNVYIILDLDPAMYFGSQGQLKARFASLIAASCAWQAFDMKDKVGGMIILGDTPIRHQPGGMRKDVLAWIQKVYDAYQIGLRRKNFDFTLGDGIKLLVNRARPGSVFHIISDFYRLDDSSWLYLRRLNKSHTVRTYQVYDKIEMSIDGKGTVGIDTGYNQGFISSLNNDFVENYRRIGIHRIHNIDKMLTEASQRNVCIDVSETILTDTSSESKD
jgi:hypothetical protein